MASTTSGRSRRRWNWLRSQRASLPLRMASSRSAAIMSPVPSSSATGISRWNKARRWSSRRIRWPSGVT
ncbi:hypothetical protein G6F50_018683 [Rhizopus delemar]|uniref:Uncharacterized protein n=1 Tax=Rhizopus delemar TaxID=936053 RepID=A0A9P7BYF4_9FUNG|nr:hypothetical protein G6F50_018683 [Rhizopus delemar]